MRGSVSTMIPYLSTTICNQLMHLLYKAASATEIITTVAESIVAGCVLLSFLGVTVFTFQKCCGCCAWCGNKDGDAGAAASTGNARTTGNAHTTGNAVTVGHANNVQLDASDLV